MIPGIGRFLAVPVSADRNIVAVGATTLGTAYVATSPDGVTWTSQTVSGAILNGVAYSSDLDLYCAVGNTGEVVTSDDGGVTWTSQTSGASFSFSAVYWNGSLFVAVGTAGIYTSPDGVTWTSRTSPIGSGGYKALTMQGSRLIAVGDDGSTGKSAYSDNGTSWTGADISLWFYYGAAANSTVIIASGNNGRISTSASGTSWTAQSSGTTQNLFDVEWNGSLFCAVGTNMIRTSPDGVTWTQRGGTLSNRFLTGIAWTGTQFVAVGSSNAPVTPRAYTSPDGLTWTEQSTGLSSAYFNAVCV